MDRRALLGRASAATLAAGTATTVLAAPAIAQTLPAAVSPPDLRTA